MRSAATVVTRQPATRRRLADRSGPFTALLIEDDRQREAATAALLTEMARLGARVIRAGTLLRFPLTLERILGEQAGPEGRVVLLAEHAETLHPDVLRSLQTKLLRSPAEVRPSLEVVFVGRPAFRDLLVGADLAPLRQALVGPTADPVVSPAAALPCAMIASPLPDAPDWGLPELAAIRPARRRGRNLTVTLVFMALLAGAAGLAYVGLRIPQDATPKPPAKAVAPPAPSPQFPSVTPPPAEPSAQVSSGPAAAGPSVPAQPVRRSPAPTPAANRSANRTWDFDGYLLRAGRDPANLTAAERSALFDEFLATRSQPNASAAPAGLAAPRIVVHVPAGSLSAEALSARLLTDLGAHPGTVETRQVAATPSRPTIRYFHPEDEPAARQAAGWMAGAGLAWTVRDFSGYQSLPSRGTIEVWLPRQP